MCYHYTEKIYVLRKVQLMKIETKFLISVILVFMLIFSVFFTAGAVLENNVATDKFYSYEQKLLCISHRGDTADYPENSLQAVKSALKKGADFVSVSLDKTKDGVFYLCERESLGNVCNAPYEKLSQVNSADIENYKAFDIYGKETKYKLTSLIELIENTDGDDGIIVDILPEHKDEVYDVLFEYGALNRIIIRANESSKKLTEWANSKSEKVDVISVYGGNIIFSTISAMNNVTKSEMPAVQYESKNYFNVAFGDFFANRYLTTENARAVTATYSPELCGQRGDSSDGWNELIKKGYSVIETNNIEAFVAYREETEKLEEAITLLIDKAICVDTAKYSDVSISNLSKAKLNGEFLVSGIVFSLDEAQQAYSKLLFALEDMKISTGEIDTRGALNVTAGKVVAAILVGTALLAGQIYVYKMRKDKKEKKSA